jgi:hypothetical protein
MKKEISISLLALSLAACGGSSSSDNKSIDSNLQVINKDFPSSIKGKQDEPTLTTNDVTEGDSIDLNSKVSGTVLATSPTESTHLTFSIPDNQLIALVLSSSSNSLDINAVTLPVHSNTLDLESSENKALIWNAVAGQSYQVEIENDTDVNSNDVNFQLKLVEANRSSLGLSTNEYVVRYNNSGTLVCVDKSGARTEETYTARHTVIFNWKEGYIKALLGTEKRKFSAVNDDSFSIIYTDSETEEGEIFNYSYNLRYTTNFETGEITGTVKNTDSTTKEGVVTENCTETLTTTGNVIL